MAQHCEYLGDYVIALKHIEAAVEATPTLPELHMIKGRIYKVCELSSLQAVISLFPASSFLVVSLSLCSSS